MIIVRQLSAFPVKTQCFLKGKLSFVVNNKTAADEIVLFYI
ncbi:hypothetical protein L323_19275 [Ruminiclostridium papyrosolvens C7]|uniref:Uncharacterized protein n=1 Tax=Ruminiclostridium papyrosolvens C7 TaxID=1330534 RepID=U4QXR5_9FIRM|nr:hypothetical protein L323_19275 [Ruminiclostridium papyrosolvens C7]